MKQSFFIISFLLTVINLFGQKTSDRLYNSKDLQYSKTDFKVIDTLKYWNYSLNLSYKGQSSDSIKPMGQLIFWRVKSLPDKMSREVYNSNWLPFMTFDIYKIRDSTFCKKISRQTIMLSSCVPPSVGGDMLIVGKYILLNKSVCLQCEKYDTNVDYCRPVINFVLNKAASNNALTIEEIVKAFPIKEGKFGAP
ncbi:MAG TPA: hypothetical protein VN958_03630 [Chitinophagaceae bacterium]|nr:hypothetical protein [Chitinophagaceae bacterium]